MDRAAESGFGPRFIFFVAPIARANLAKDFYRGADKSLARPGRKKANVSVQNGVNFLRHLACAEYITGVLISP